MPPPVKLSNLARTAFGNVLEWYDFSLYIYFSLYLGYAFFPGHDPVAAKLMSYGVFFLGALVRPFGAFCLGFLGDRFGLRWSINVCVIVMGVSTFSVALLPSYSSIGIMAPTLLIILRLLQGLSAGGQLPNLITLTVQEQGNKSGFAVGLIFSISSLGFWLASLVGFFSTSFFQDMHNELMWRLPFALSGILFLVYLWINRHQFVAQDTNVIKQPALLRSLMKQWRSFFAVVFLTTMAASIYMLLYTYLINYRIEYLQVPPGGAFLMNTIVLLVAIIAYPLFGRIVDHFGSQRIFFASTFVLLLLIYPLINLLDSAGLAGTLSILLVVTLLLAAIQAAISPLFASTFSSAWQATACALAYSIGNAVSGGAPLFAEFALRFLPHGLGSLFLIFTCIGFVGMLILTRDHFSSLKEVFYVHDRKLSL